MPMRVRLSKGLAHSAANIRAEGEAFRGQGGTGSPDSKMRQPMC